MRTPTKITAVVCLAAGTFTAFADPGDLDTTFGTGGRVTLDIGAVTTPPVTDPPTPPPPAAASEGSAITVQPDGKIVIAALTGNKTTVLRLNDAGALDTTFNTTGKLPIVFASTSKDYLRDIAFSSSGPAVSPQQIVVAGYSNALSGDFTFALARIKTDGTVLGTTASSGTRYGTALALQTDGKWVIAGHNVLARYTNAGVLDTAFDGDGRTLFNFNAASQVNGVAVQADGKVIAVGTSSSPAPNAFVMGRYNADGTLDTSFGTGGFIRTQINALASAANRVAILPNGRIVVAGSTLVPYTAEAPNTRDFAVVRYFADGSLDTSFNGTGIATASVVADDGTEVRMTVQPDGKILVGGAKGLVRFNADGTLDTSFSTDGKVTLDFILAGIAMQPNGRIVVTGGDKKVEAARYLSGIPGPEITVEDPAGNTLTSGAATPVDLGEILPGETKSVFFTVRNIGAPELTSLAISKTADSNPPGFTIFPLIANDQTVTSLAAGASATFAVIFSSNTPGTRTATLNIASNDADENPFVIKLTGLRRSSLEVWRQQHFGSMANTGDGADLADPDHDGIVNLLEFATASNPKLGSPSIIDLIKNGSNWELTYTRARVAKADWIFRLEGTTTPALQTWSTAGLEGETIVSSNDTTELVKVAFPANDAQTRFVRLRVAALEGD